MEKSLRGKKGRKLKPRGQPSFKRVKVVDDADTSKKTKIMRRQNNNASILLSMPLDVIFSVFLKLNIKDLVMLTYTNKSLRDALLGENAINIWKTARENSRVPDPPHDFSEQRWASFLFGSTFCQCCSAPSVYTVDFYLRRRLCIRCKLDNYITGSSFSRSLAGLDKTLLNLIPHSDVGALHYGHLSSSRFYWKKDTENIIQRWNELKSGSRSFRGKQQLEDFCIERNEFVKTILQEGKIYMEWDQRVSQELSDEIREWKNAIYVTICQRFCDLGYEKCDMLGIEGEELVDTASELTDSGWARIRPGLEQIIIEARDRRLEFERQRRRENRLHNFKKLFDAHCLTVLPAVWLQYPYWREVATFPEFSLIIDSAENVNEESFAPAIEKLPSLIESWLENKRATLKQELYNSQTTIHSSTKDDLDLAIAIFKCAGYGCRQNNPLYAEVSSNPLFGWADAASHMCSSYNSLNMWYFIPTNSTYIKTVITPFEKASAVAARLVRLVGLDPSCTTTADMDRSGYCFFCSGCPKRQDRQKAYPWRAAVAHGASHKHRDEPAWQVLTSAQMLDVEVLENPNN